MTNVFKPFEKRKLSAKNKALLAAWKDVHFLCNNRNDISYNIASNNKDDLPIEYEIIFHIKTFIGLKEGERVENTDIKAKVEEEQFLLYPEFGDKHHMQLIIPPNFPQVSAKPKGKIVSQIWHPNIVCHGDANILGRICFNEGNLDAGVTLADRILQVAEYLTYENYLAEDREPHPYDNDVAFWIREVAEPMEWVIPGMGINYEKLGISPEEIRKSEVQTGKKHDSEETADKIISKDENLDDGFEIVDEYETKTDGNHNDDYESTNVGELHDEDEEILEI